jgi:BAR-like protein/PH (Pleckstrin Homology) domain-containing protein
LETAKALKGSVLPTFERLHTETKNKSKELIRGAGKGSKAVEKARGLTQKHIELLGQYTAVFDSTGGKIGPSEDPYILQRGVVHRLNKQIQEENANRADLLAVQNNFASFEAHIIQTFQSGLGQFNTVISKQADVTKSLYGDMVGNAQRVPANFEWEGFLKRNSAILIDPTAPDRNINTINFPNQNHRATQPLISGSLQRKTKLLRRYETFFYVVSPSKYLHEFKTDDDFSKDPIPEMSLFLPDCIVGAVVGDKFAIKGKDTNKGKMGIGVHTTHEFNFKAHTASDAADWHNVIRHVAGQVTAEAPDTSTPNSPSSVATGEGEKFGSIGHGGRQDTGRREDIPDPPDFILDGYERLHPDVKILRRLSSLRKS